MSLLTIRDAVTGDVVMDENDFISRHLMSIEIPFADTDQHTITVPGLNTGTPYYIFDPRSNIHTVNVTTGIFTTGYFSCVEVTFSGSAVTYQHRYITSLSGNGVTQYRNGNNVWLHIGVY